MSSVDTAWLRMERADNPMMITGVIVFKEKVSYKTLLRVLDQRFVSFRRFRCRPVVDLRSNAHWEMDDDFDIKMHVHRAALPGRAREKELQEFVAELASSRLAVDAPLWHFHLIEKFNGRSALVMRIHHCYADGMALIRVLFSMTGETREKSLKSKPRKKTKSRDRGLLERAEHLLEAPVKIGASLWREGFNLLTNPARAGEFAKVGADIAQELAGLTLRADDPKTLLRKRLGLRKVVAWSEPIPLADVKTIARTWKCKVNDVLLAAAAGAFNKYMREREDVDESLSIRAAVPVNLRSPDEPPTLGNRFGLVLLKLPVGRRNPLERLFEVRREMQKLKTSRQPVVTYGLLSALGRGPGMLQQPALEMLSQKASAVMTNVPGPQKALFLAGSEIDQMMFWVPSSGEIGVGVSILSYDGKVQFGLIADHNIIKNPAEVASGFATEFEKLVMATMMSPWSEKDG